MAKAVMLSVLAPVRDVVLLVIRILDHVVLSLVAERRLPHQVNPGERVKRPEDVVDEPDNLRRAEGKLIIVSSGDSVSELDEFH